MEFKALISFNFRGSDVLREWTFAGIEYGNPSLETGGKGCGKIPGECLRSFSFSARNAIDWPCPPGLCSYRETEETAPSRATLAFGAAPSASTIAFFIPHHLPNSGSVATMTDGFGTVIP
jgi:hypothetical protein